MSSGRTQNQEGYIFVGQVPDIYHVSDRTLRRHIQKGAIKTKKAPGKKGRLMASTADLEALFPKKDTSKDTELIQSLREEIKWLREELRLRNDMVNVMSEDRTKSSQAVLILLRQIQDKLPSNNRRFFGLLPVKTTELPPTP